MKRTVFIVFLCITLGFLASLFIPLPRERFQRESVHSMEMLDRRGVLLREFLSDEQGRGQWVPLSQISPELVQATIAIEDKRYQLHPGVDPLALVRAVVTNIRAGEWRSGGSTLTQQVIRNIYHHPRTVPYKLLEMWYALRLERMMGKKEILEQYLNRAPYGNQLFGVEAAARWYFGKSARDLSLAESAYLAGLPNAPSVLNPYRNSEAAIARQRVVLRCMLEQERISDDEFRRAYDQPLTVLPPEANFRAPHFVEMVARELESYPHPAVVQTTLDYALQQEIHWIVKGHLATLASKNVTNAAVLVIDNRSGEVRALLGSADYFDEKISGQVNGVLALRQPGSALKPFTYGVALEGGFSPATILADIPTHIPDEQGDYIPENYDKRYHGPVRLRTALACSYNVPAVRTAQRIGVVTLLQRLHLAGFASLTQPASYYGYGLTLGNGDVTLLELANAYASLANGGLWKPVWLLRSLQTVAGEQIDLEAGSVPIRRRVFDERVTFLLTNILSDPVARRPAFGAAFEFPFACAVKTGTTKDYRDNWTVGFTTQYTVGVWVGNFDGSPMRGVSGLTGAGPIFSDVMMLLHQHNTPEEFRVPDGLRRLAVCPRSGKLPTKTCSETIVEWFQRGDEPKKRCNVHHLYRVVEGGKARIRAYEVAAPEFRAWAEQERIPTPPPGAKQVPLSEQNLQSADRSGALRPSILYPNDGDQFKLDPVLRREYQSIKILGVTPDGSTQPVLRDNDNAVAYNASGSWWLLKRGRHTLQLEAIVGGAKRKSAPVTIFVE